MSLRCVLALSALLPSALMAQASLTPAPADFEMQMPLTLSGNNGVVQLLLPKQVYLHSRTPDLSDIRVFNGAGELLPFAFLPTNAKPAEPTQISFRESAAAIFPVHSSGNTRARDLQLEVKSSADGSLLAISAQSAEPAATKHLSALILDLGWSAPTETLEALRLRLPEAASDYRALLSIDRSWDLKLWDTVAQSSIDWLSGTGDVRLVNDRIEIPSSEGRYLRVRWVEGDPLEFAQVLARWRGAPSHLERPLSDPVYEVKLVAQVAPIDSDFVFSTSPSIAATEIGLNLPETNTVVPVGIGFYRETPGRSPVWNFEPRVENTFYRLMREGSERSSSRLAVGPIQGTDWVVRAYAQTPAIAQPGPELVLRWKPRSVAFTARGNDFKLAFGADPAFAQRASGQAVAVERVAPGYRVDELSGLETAVAGKAYASPRPTGALPAVAATAADDGHRRRFILWSILILGVLILAYMSWRLFAQMGQSEQR